MRILRLKLIQGQMGLIGLFLATNASRRILLVFGENAQWTKRQAESLSYAFERCRSLSGQDIAFRSVGRCTKAARSDATILWQLVSRSF